jgi:hypothetical protein
VANLAAMVITGTSSFDGTGGVGQSARGPVDAKRVREEFRDYGAIAAAGPSRSRWTSTAASPSRRAPPRPTRSPSPQRRRRRGLTSVVHPRDHQRPAQRRREDHVAGECEMGRRGRGSPSRHLAARGRADLFAFYSRDAGARLEFNTSGRRLMFKLHGGKQADPSSSPRTRRTTTSSRPRAVRPPGGRGVTINSRRIRVRRAAGLGPAIDDGRFRAGLDAQDRQQRLDQGFGGNGGAGGNGQATGSPLLASTGPAAGRRRRDRHAHPDHDRQHDQGTSSAAVAAAVVAAVMSRPFPSAVRRWRWWRRRSGRGARERDAFGHRRRRRRQHRGGNGGRAAMERRIRPGTGALAARGRQATQALAAVATGTGRPGQWQRPATPMAPVQRAPAATLRRAAERQRHFLAGRQQRRPGEGERRMTRATRSARWACSIASWARSSCQPWGASWDEYHAWMAAGGVPDPEPAPEPVSIEEALANKLAEIEDRAASQRRRVTGAASPQEMSSWTLKRDQALAFDPAVGDKSAPMLAARGAGAACGHRRHRGPGAGQRRRLHQAEAAIAGVVRAPQGCRAAARHCRRGPLLRRGRRLALRSTARGQAIPLVGRRRQFSRSGG